MNLEAENIRLIDISSEDDLLIDSHFDSSSFDLRLSGFLELEELCLVNRGFKNAEAGLSRGTEESVRSKICLERNASHKPAVQAGSRQKTQALIKPKLASPSKMTSMQDSKPLHMSRRSSAIPRVVSKPHVIQSATGRRESLKSTRAEGLTRVPTTHTKKSPLQVDRSGEILTVGRLGARKCRRSDSRSVSSVSSSQSALSSVASSNSIDLSPHRNYSDDAQNTNLWRSPVMQGEHPRKSSSPMPCDNLQTGHIEATPQNSSQQVLNYDVNESQNLDRQQSHLSPLEQTSLRKGLLRQSAPNAAMRSPLFADTQRSSKPSSLRVPSQKIGFFDMRSEELEPISTGLDARASDLSKSVHSKDQDEPTYKLKHLKSRENQKAYRGNKGKMCNENLEAATKDQRRRNQHEHCLVKRTGSLRIEEKENICHPEDTVIELSIKHSSPSPSKPSVKTSESTSNHEIEVDLRNLCRMYDRLWLAEGHDHKDHKAGANSPPMKRTERFRG
ncbi:hypothetical protein Cgig2_014020 [Carnegiea gigantea]|uniref:Uncharacterized protein n=1 Tax=Carnegiea gigantea TaxID=171969 RepID=A0A9Q1KYK4_9CARY|nr:hypothetical protein Cgig2_014020 [Carnegiea gigantea]